MSGLPYKSCRWDMGCESMPPDSRRTVARKTLTQNESSLAASDHSQINSRSANLASIIPYVVDPLIPGSSKIEIRDRPPDAALSRATSAKNIVPEYDIFRRVAVRLAFR